MAKVVLYMAISSDGFIADEYDQTPWSDEEWHSFQAFAKSCNYVVMGRRTYEIMKKEDDFIKGPTYIIATSDKELNTPGFKKLSIQSKDDLPKNGKVGIIGGGELNGRLAKLDLIDEMILDIDGQELGDGIRLFGTYDIPLKLELIASKRIDPQTVQRHYRVLH